MQRIAVILVSTLLTISCGLARQSAGIKTAGQLVSQRAGDTGFGKWQGAHGGDKWSNTPATGIILQAEHTEPDRHGLPPAPNVWVVCMKRQPYLTLTWPDVIAASSGGVSVKFRFDSRAPISVGGRRTESFMSVIFYDYNATEVIVEMLRSSKMLVGVDVVAAGPRDAEFDVRGLAAALAEFRAECGM